MNDMKVWVVTCERQSHEIYSASTVVIGVFDNLEDAQRSAKSNSGMNKGG